MTSANVNQRESDYAQVLDSDQIVGNLNHSSHHSEENQTNPPSPPFNQPPTPPPPQTLAPPAPPAPPAATTTNDANFVVVDEDNYHTIGELQQNAVETPAVAVSSSGNSKTKLTKRSTSTSETREKKKGKSKKNVDDTKNQKTTNKTKKNEKKKKKKKKGEENEKKEGYGWPELPPFSYRWVPDFVAWLFGCYGYAMGKYPWLFLLIGIAVGGAGAAGLMYLRIATDNDLINQFIERGSRYFKDDEVIQRWKNATKDANAPMRKIELEYEGFTNQQQQKQQQGRRKRQAENIQVGSGAGVCQVERFREWRIQSVIIEAKHNDSLIALEAMQDAFDLANRIRELLKCDHNDRTDHRYRLYCCESWDIVRMKASRKKGKNEQTNKNNSFSKFYFIFHSLE